MSHILDQAFPVFWQVLECHLNVKHGADPDWSEKPSKGRFKERWQRWDELGLTP
jgi:hypothetical protein